MNTRACLKYFVHDCRANRYKIFQPKTKKNPFKKMESGMLYILKRCQISNSTYA